MGNRDQACILGISAAAFLLEIKKALAEFEDFQLPASTCSLRTECTCKILPFPFLQKDAKMDILYRIMRVPKKLSGLHNHFPLSATYLLKFSGYSLTLIILVSVILPTLK